MEEKPEPCIRCCRRLPPLVRDPDGDPDGPMCMCIPCAGKALGMTPQEMVKALIELKVELMNEDEAARLSKN